MFKSNCHTHTTYCDGKNSAEDMVIAAIEKGFKSIGFSGHGPMIYESDWAMSKKNLDKYIDEIKHLKDKYADKIDVLCGLELDADYSVFDSGKFDYFICSVHQFIRNGKDYPIDFSADVLAQLVDELFDGDWIKMAAAYYDKLADFVIKMKPQVVGHFDLITKYNDNNAQFDVNNTEYQKLALSAVDRILDADSDVLFEVNTGAMFRLGNSAPYPAEFIMKHLCDRNAKLTVTSDAHCVEALDFAFDIAYKHCRDNGFNKLYALSSDGRVEFNI